MSSGTQRLIQVSIECVELPAHDWGGHSEIWLGIQCGKDVVQDIKLPIDHVVFRAELRIGNDPTQGPPNFLGPFAQGAVEDRFVYLCWGRRVGGAWIGFRRAKLKLCGLNWDNLHSDRLLARVRCTDAKGGPICASLKSDVVTWLSPAETPLPIAISDLSSEGFC